MPCARVKSELKLKSPARAGFFHFLAQIANWGALRSGTTVPNGAHTTAEKKKKLAFRDDSVTLLPYTHFAVAAGSVLLGIALTRVDRLPKVCLNQLLQGRRGDS
jgi:hypothetical protein